MTWRTRFQQGWLLLALSGAVPLVTQCSRPAYGEDFRLELANPEGERQGYIKVEPKTGRFEIYDRYSRHLGYGTYDSVTGKVETYDLHSRKVAPGHGLDGKGKRR